MGSHRTRWKFLILLVVTVVRALIRAIRIG
jgi:hypothetical protein